MIHPDSRTAAWIEKVAKENNVKDIALAEKTIRAFSLLEALVRSGCPLKSVIHEAEPRWSGWKK
ncbi:MAG: hypothetical protein Q4F82_04630 [bacterium]|nr:hypothetical protein [bacterium]